MKTMRIKTNVLSLLSVFVLSGLLLTPSSAQATTITECQALIDLVRLTLDGAVIEGGNPELTRASLESKLDGAKIKLDQGKVCDALQKLKQFRAKVEELRDADKPKISQEDAQSLIAAVNDAIACVEQLPGGGDCL